MPAIWFSLLFLLLWPKISTGTQVDQKWPLVCHLLTLVLQSGYRSVEECGTSFTLFPGLFTLHVRLSEGFNTFWHFTTWECSEVFPPFILDHGKRSVNRVVWKGVKGVYTAMVKEPLRKWDRVDTVCALLVDLGMLNKSKSKCGHYIKRKARMPLTVNTPQPHNNRGWGLIS